VTARQLAITFRSALTGDQRENVRKIIMFGSRARGEEREDSDLDIAVLVRERTPEVERSLEDCAYRVMWDNDFKPIISLKVLSEAQFDEALQKGFSFYKHLAERGIEI